VSKAHMHMHTPAPTSTPSPQPKAEAAKASQPSAAAAPKAVAQGVIKKALKTSRISSTAVPVSKVLAKPSQLASQPAADAKLPTLNTPVLAAAALPMVALGAARSGASASHDASADFSANAGAHTNAHANTNAGDVNDEWESF
jgi:hypothetical protein